MLRIFNSLAGEKQTFRPIEPGRVRMYVCGITVYDYLHVGHARMMVVFDMVVRYLRSSGYDVTYVRNITDIDDKIIRRAAEAGEPVRAITERFTRAMHDDAATLGMLPPDVEPRATAHVDDIVAMVVRLLDLGYAYQAGNGDVYYDVSHFEGYGKLSNKRVEDLRAGARVEVDQAKDDPLDFVLWKAAKPGEPAWDSPWGPGRPGWHIECSAMSRAHLGRHFDIHGGGMDLKFPHHENEIAQSEAANGPPFVNYWMHNGFVQIDDEKMSKSLGNFFTLREVLGRYRAEVVRMFILSSHYRSPLNYSTENLEQARTALLRLYTALRGTVDDGVAADPPWVARFREVMDDDFNTPEALAVLFELARELNRARREGAPEAVGLASTLRALGHVLGLLSDEPERFLRSGGLAAVHVPGIEVRVQAPVPAVEGYISTGGPLTDEMIDNLVKERESARRTLDWAEADRIRDRLAAAGVVLEDGPQGTLWRRA